jgi:nickel-dependent lactate racemase
MNVSLAYGKTRLPLALPSDRTTVIEPRYVPGIPRAREYDALTEALRAPLASPRANAAPLREALVPADRVVILICDITRAIPTARILPPLLAELSSAGIPDENILVLNATGTHRGNTPPELERMVGRDVFARYRVENHDSADSDAHTLVGTTPGGRTVKVDTRLLASSVRILTGFIEPHFFAGFSGGPKMVVPGVASLETVMQMHDAQLIGEPRATWGLTRGENPLWQELDHAAKLALSYPFHAPRVINFNYNVTLNRDLDITGIFAGDLDASHAAGCAYAREIAMQGVDTPFDIVVTTNSGYPLDLNLYQTVKGMSAAAQIVREGGDIVVASECSEGFPEHGRYRELLGQGATPAQWLALVHAPGFSVHDQWQVQIQAQIQQKARVHLHAGGLTDAEIRSAQIEPARDLPRTIAELSARHGPHARICVLPEGPQTIPFLAAR